MSEFSLLSIGPVFFIGGFLIFLVLIWRNATRKHRQAKILFISIILGLLSQLSEVFQVFFVDVEQFALIFQFSTETFIILSITLLGVFWARLTEAKVKGIWITLFLLGTILDLSMYGFWILLPEYANAFQKLITITGNSFYAGLIILFGFLALPLYWRMFRYTREFTALLLLISICVTLSGFIIGFIFWVGAFFGGLLPSWWINLSALEFGLWYSGEFLYWFILTLKIDYVYRLPFDVHRLLVISRTNGLVAYEAHFVTRKGLQIDNDLLAGFFTALNNIFLEVGRKNIALESVAGPGMNFIIDWGEFIATLVVTDQDTYYLRHAMRQFTIDFEKRYSATLHDTKINSSAYEKSNDLIERNFPFMKVRK